jgi:hypothetical protein
VGSLDGMVGDRTSMVILLVSSPCSFCSMRAARRLFVAPTKRGNEHMVQLSRQSFMMAKPTISMPGCRKVRLGMR